MVFLCRSSSRQLSVTSQFLLHVRHLRKGLHWAPTYDSAVAVGLNVMKPDMAGGRYWRLDAKHFNSRCAGSAIPGKRMVSCRAVKRSFSRHCGPDLHRDEWMNESKRQRKETKIWQRRFWEHRIRDERDFEKHVDYVHFNPVKHNLVRKTHHGTPADLVPVNRPAGQPEIEQSCSLTSHSYF